MTAAPRRGAGRGVGSLARRARRAATHLRGVLAAVLDRVEPRTHGIEYRLVGPAAEVLRGAPIPEYSLDLLLRERRGVDVFAAALASMPGVRCRLPPHESEGRAEYFARYMFLGAAFEATEVVADAVTIDLGCVERESDTDTDGFVGRGPWTHYSLVRCGAHAVPAVALELRLLSGLDLHRANRPNHFDLTLEYLGRRGCEVDLVRRGLADRGDVPEELRREILDRLGGAAHDD
jgi:hypothetical protein